MTPILYVLLPIRFVLRSFFLFQLLQFPIFAHILAVHFNQPRVKRLFPQRQDSKLLTPFPRSKETSQTSTLKPSL
ncbi:hypothetical protein BJ878DRAFT_506886 [Calycina marina]|uniref:Uncharacterized protein n=1 Tax=Calycina marina TaxID=1763456 RepID=A0A9P7Z2F1_9HELO|nr:hypothetical protein BJ878DRAFT_506886 [Calycina marina]